MLLQLKSLSKSVAILLAALVLFTQNAEASEPQTLIQPVWEKINGEWKFNNTKKNSYESLVYVVTTTKNNSTKSILTKDMVKLPFVLILDGHKKEEITLH
jgi:negative regulator of sigma E activity